jgi:hypothetical protein
MLAFAEAAIGKYSRAMAATLFFAGFASQGAHAAGTAPMAWVSGSGNDSPACGPATTPCRTFQYAHDNIVFAGGEIRVFDSAGYSPIVIRNAISIVNDSAGLAGISGSAPGTTPVTIQAGANDQVLLKGLTLDGAGNGTNGIKIVSVGSLTIANCVAKGFTNGSGLLIDPTNSPMKFAISDSIFWGNGSGITVNGAGKVVSGTITRVEASGNSGAGVEINNTTGTFANQVNASNNQNGFSVSGTLSLTRSIVAANKTGVLIASGGTVNTYGDNAINFNDVADVSGGTLSTTNAFK